MAQCAQCMFENADDAATCEQCGADLAVEVLSLQLGEVCRKCDSYNDPGVRVCVSCGQPLGSEPVEAKLPPATAPEDTPVASIPASQPWMAPPDTGEFTGVSPSKEPPRPAAELKFATLPPTGNSPVISRINPAPPSPLPPSALPPGFVSSVTRPGPPNRSLQEAPVACPRCRAQNPPSARYCGTCGTGLLPQPSVLKARGKLVLVRGIGAESKQFPLANASNTAGRNEGAVTFPDDPYVGPLHATLLYRGDNLFVKDEGAANGIYVRLREPQPLRPGDMFNVGERLLRYGGVEAFPPQGNGRHGSPRVADRVQILEEIVEGGCIGRVCKRAGPSVTIGRAGCDLNFPMDGFVSARHVEVSASGENATLRDLGSANGTFFRVPAHAERPLSHGDYLLIGRELLRVEMATAR